MTIQNLFSLKYIAILFVSLVISNLTFAMEHNHSMHHQSTSLEVHNPWVRSAPPNAPMLGAFMQIKNILIIQLNYYLHRQKDISA